MKNGRLPAKTGSWMRPPRRVQVCLYYTPSTQKFNLNNTLRLNIRVLEILFFLGLNTAPSRYKCLKRHRSKASMTTAVVVGLDN
jgi:hypothetical protein